MASHDQTLKAGELKGQTEEKASQTLVGAKDVSEGAKDKAFETAQVAKGKTADATEVVTADREAPVKQKGVVEATTEGVMGAAASAADAVKRTLGMDDSTKKP